jgi:NAD(P)-dependent dehydrogenase (short-subunit alcohol dehydrogenase family)
VKASDSSREPSVVITGASAGIGRATAIAFANRGWSIGLIARGRERLHGAERDVERAGGRVLVLPADVANASAIDEAASRAEEELGPIDVWVNDAIATVFSSFGSITPEEFRRVTEVTYLGAVHGTMAALASMRPRDTGVIVQVGSALAYRPIPLQSGYCAAKFAVRGFTDALRCELLHEQSRIRLTMVQLPAVDTPQFDWARSRLPRRLQPVPPIHAPETVAEAIFRAAVEAPRELWVGGPTVKAILGSFAAPALLDRLAAERAWRGQMTDEPARARPDNLFDAPPGDPGTHGRFGNRSCRHVSAVSEAGARTILVVTALGAGAGIAALGFMLGVRNRRPRAIARKRGAPDALFEPW